MENSNSDRKQGTTKTRKSNDQRVSTKSVLSQYGKTIFFTTTVIISLVSVALSLWNQRPYHFLPKLTHSTASLLVTHEKVLTVGTTLFMAAVTVLSTFLSVRSYRETQRQFAIGNEPYLQIFTDFTRDTDNLINGISCTLTNYGKMPVMMLTHEYVYTNDESIQIDDEQYNECLPNVEKENRILLSMEKPVSLTDLRFVDAVKESTNANYWVYIMGRAVYENLTTKKIKTYTYRVKMNLTKRIYLTNENC